MRGIRGNPAHSKNNKETKDEMCLCEVNGLCQLSVSWDNQNMTFLTVQSTCLLIFTLPILVVLVTYFTGRFQPLLDFHVLCENKNKLNIVYTL